MEHVKINDILFLVWCTVCMTQTVVVTGTNTTINDPVVIQVKVTEWSSQLAEKNPEVKVNSHNISIIGDEFVLDGKPLHIHSGSLHYFRLPSEYWRDRLQKLKAAGLNSVSTYVEWSFHQPEEDTLLFSGDHDVARFIRIAAEEGLYVLLRPGPYICAERDLGGFPYWLLSKYPQIRLRTTDKDFIRESRIWMAKLFAQVETLLIGNGGPIIMVQVENEYGSYGSDKVYMGLIRDIIKEYVGSNALLYTADGPYRSMIYDGSITGALTAINFGSVRNVMDTVRPLREYMPTGPLMNAEFYPGWLTHWSENLQQVPTQHVVRTLQDMLKHNMSFNFYMFFGGTNFEYTAGANYDKSYVSDITSYDYDAPLTEAGDPTPKYYAIRDTLIKDKNLPNEPAPLPSKKGSYGPYLLSPRVKLLSAKGRSNLSVKYKSVKGSVLPTFEELRQRGGLVIYETTLTESGGLLEIKKPRDWIYVFVNGVLQGIINRMNRVYTLTIKADPGSVLSLLVENQGRINYGDKIHDFKGILGTVSYNNNILSATWDVSGFPLQNPTIRLDEPDLKENEPLNLFNDGPVLFETCFELMCSQKPLDTFLDTTGWGKGYVWINGHNLGRYWPGVGPQVTLFVPGVWLQPNPQKNCIQVLELESSPTAATIQFIDYPILNRTGYQKL